MIGMHGRYTTHASHMRGEQPTDVDFLICYRDTLFCRGHRIQSKTGTLIALAAQKLGEGPASDLLSSALRIAVHQTLSLRTGAQGWERGRVGGELLYSGDNASAAANAIRSLKASSLNQVIADQLATMRRTPPPTVNEFMQRFSAAHPGQAPRGLIGPLVREGGFWSTRRGAPLPVGRVSTRRP